MALTPKQHGRHKKEWDLACAKQGWDPKDDRRRLDFYRRHRLPISRADWHPKKHFDIFLAEVAALQNRVDIRDRARESVDRGIVRMNAALRLITDDDFARGILADMHDRSSWDRLTDAQLANLRNTLHNRLARCLARIRGTNVRGRAERLACPPALAWVEDCAVNPAIDAIIAGKVALRRSNGRAVWYEAITRAQWRQLQRTGRLPAAPLQTEPADDFSDAPSAPTRGETVEQAELLPAPPKPRASDTLHALSAAVGHNLADLTDDDIPF